jgi:putative hydrolase of the HAD superfamily
MNEDDRRRFVALIRDAAAAAPSPASPVLSEEFGARLFPQSLGPLSDIRAVLVDVYGTLFSSAAGEIGVGTDYLRGNLDAVASLFCPNLTGEELKDFFRSSVLAEHLRLFPTTPYPEVRVEELWARLPGLLPGADCRELALRFELAVNPSFPIEGLADCLSSLRRSKFKLGIVSNAQFFTPLLFEAFLGASPEDCGFEADLIVYSFERGEAKPSPALFAAARDALASRGISAAQTLYLGNDMLNDIYAAHGTGMRTCLFAGDPRSLRLREDNRLCRGLLPDAVIQSLADLPALVGKEGSDRG